MANTYDDYFKEKVDALAKMEKRAAHDAHNPYLMREYINTANGLLFAVMNVVERLADKEEKEKGKEEAAVAPVGTSIATTQRLIGDWAHDAFPASTTEATLRHLWKEMAELDTAVERNSHPQACEEAADLFILLAQLCNRMHIDLEAAVREKHNVNVHRLWQPPDADGIVYHQKEQN